MSLTGHADGAVQGKRGVRMASASGWMGVRFPEMSKELPWVGGGHGEWESWGSSPICDILCLRCLLDMNMGMPRSWWDKQIWDARERWGEEVIVILVE